MKKRPSLKNKGKEELDQKYQISKLNDHFRANIRQGEQLTITPGIANLPQKDVIEILTSVQTYNDFSLANDPYGEHNFGRIIYNDNIIYWKIDYLDTNMEVGSEDPSDPIKTNRVMTLMLSHEW